ncbi:hypothetical protein [Fusobacterium sp.]|uniref:hypothetical protein n=1 Tax=Fusobacterium sp. TaxID=68766 RepID=UPI0029024E3A|nr:hypothetical protein [Fusobacterium sp.]MDU1911058.1 hypothetical protein [Fusobacterium sp.]
MLKLSKPIKIRKNGKEKDTTEIEIKPEDFTAKILLEAEREFLLTGGVFPKGEMENSRAYQGYIAAKILECRIDDLEELPATDFLKITNVVKGFFDGLELENLTQILLGK